MPMSCYMTRRERSRNSAAIGRCLRERTSCRKVVRPAGLYQYHQRSRPGSSSNVNTQTDALIPEPVLILNHAVFFRVTHHKKSPRAAGLKALVYRTCRFSSTRPQQPTPKNSFPLFWRVWREAAFTSRRRLRSPRGDRAASRRSVPWLPCRLCIHRASSRDASRLFQRQRSWRPGSPVPPNES